MAKIQLTYLENGHAVLTLDNNSQFFQLAEDAVALGNSKLRPEWNTLIAGNC